MLGRWLLDFWHGYVVVTLRGEQVPDLINKATAAGIMLWEIRQTRDGHFRLKMHREDVKRLRTILKQTGVRIHFERKFGIPFLIWRAWRRKFFLAGAVTFLIALYVLTSMIWKVDVEIVGNFKHLSPETIEQAAAEIGLHQGAWMAKLPDTDDLQKELLQKVPELSIVHVKIQGTKVHIEAVEKVPGVEKPNTAPQNVVAAKKGVIRNIFAKTGNKVATRNQFVQPGQVLISGTLGDSKTNVHAEGQVWATVYYKSTVSIPLKTTRKEYTGEAVEKQFLTFWGHPVQIWGYGQLPYSKYEEHPEDKALKIGSFVFPIQYRDTTYQEVKEEQVILNEQEAIKQALELSKADVARKMGKGGRVESQKPLQKEIKDGKLEIQVLNIVVEDIGQPQPYTPAPPVDPNAKPGADANTTH
ncbi:MAG: sporulation protein YqfD [Tumebacillaceae bacterium]